ncbi:hypothetical protein [Rhodococcus sp. IEGM 1305]|uniref:hypothetical protein n=2 Tax=unclassified Rhodococcus (in: high G+C Gram-positive bacteria) TaxID=192944 RepID=UPI0032D5ADCA
MPLPFQGRVASMKVPVTAVGEPSCSRDVYITRCPAPGQVPSVPGTEANNGIGSVRMIDPGADANSAGRVQKSSPGAACAG